MTNYVALIRGINVGGHNILPMKELVQILTKLSFTNIKTYIQSGNVVFCSSMLDDALIANKISTAILQNFGFEAAVQVLKKQDFLKIAAANPFTENISEQDAKTVHVFFLGDSPKNINLEDIAKIATPKEKWHLAVKAFYLFTPEGLHNSKLALKVEKLLAVSATARNWRTILKISELLQ